MDGKLKQFQCSQPTSLGLGSNHLSRRSFLAASTAAATTAVVSPAALAEALYAAGETRTRFKRISTQFIAALGEPDATSGSNAHLWGLWRRDPGPRGVRLDRYERLKATGGVAPAKWQFHGNDWWLEEHGLIMEAPAFPVPAGKFLVTGDREARTTLTIYPMDESGVQRWELADSATLHDVTHLACRSARYTPASAGSCSPVKAQKTDFPVRPGAPMPPVEGCNKQDYAVLLVIGVAKSNG